MRQYLTARARGKEKVSTKQMHCRPLLQYYLVSLFRRIEWEATLLHNPLGLLRFPREAKFFDKGEDVAGELLLKLRHITHEHEERLGLPATCPQRTNEPDEVEKTGAKGARERQTRER